MHERVLEGVVDCLAGGPVDKSAELAVDELEQGQPGVHAPFERTGGPAGTEVAAVAEIGQDLFG